MLDLIDTHAHIHFADYQLDAAGSLKSAAEVGVGRVICVGTSTEDSQKAVDFANQHNNVWATVGAHPHDGQDFLANQTTDKELLRQLAKNPKVVAIGEIGLDYYHPHTTKERQIEALRSQIDLAVDLELPIVFHVRDAWQDFWPIIDSYQNLKGVIHSFTAHIKELNEILQRDLMISLNGIMTFTKDQAQLEAAKAVPLDKLLLETDAPFLTPKPFRGKICEPKHVRNTAEFLAELRGESLEELAAATTNNAEHFFGLN